MKLAAGCFGCLAFTFFLLTLAWGTIYGTIASASPELAQALAPFSGFVQYINGGCCCLSSLTAIVFLIIGLRSGGSEAAES